ncbi:MAG: UDP-N-acetylglucosamine 2-epimerase (non-hydrolyzing) [Leptolinea sp.]|nr:UDP-N-acetylglucosamine 2-epimerase (non-hydrolyzing) [Leptolinea sp.]
MNTIKILSIFGTRPEAIKMAPVVKQLEATAGIESRVCVTAQHREMLDQVLSLFDIQPDIDLNLMQPNQQLAGLTSEILTHLDPVFTNLQPDWILVQGDTTTAMTAALGAYYRHILVGHVEAGLRTFDKWQPFPEEINRRIISTVADLHFAPTEWSRSNLLHEGVTEEHIRVTGNTVVDALQTIVNRPAPAEINTLFREIGISDQRELILVTAHRRENLGEPLANICQAILSLAERYVDRYHFIYPVHRNPNVSEPVHKILGGHPAIHLLQPLEYLPLVHLLKNARLVLTDSGGIQEEAVSLGKPTLVLREKTERPEGLDSGILQLVGTDPQKIVTEAEKILSTPSGEKRPEYCNPFGDGQAARRIVEAILGHRENGG